MCSSLQAHKEAKPFRKRPFPLFAKLTVLVGGVVATGEDVYRPAAPLPPIDPTLHRIASEPMGDSNASTPVTNVDSPGLFGASGTSGGENADDEEDDDLVVEFQLVIGT
jgi:hypothetical protein